MVWGLDHRQIESHREITAGDVPDADVVVATWWETAEWVARYPASKGAKAYFIQHHEVHEGLPEERVDATWTLPMHKIVIANWLADLSRERFGDSDYSLVPNSVDTAQFNAPPREKQKMPTVGMMYSHVPFKGCDISLKAFNIAAAKVPGLEAGLVREPRADAGASVARRRGFHAAAAAAKRSVKSMPRADAWLFASRSEGFGLPILEGDGVPDAGAGHACRSRAGN